ncbi:hypothetical protein GA830_10140 [Mesorhizobium sp. NBSH29]|nr:hypothetical protein GA830_10140 [Mesorhizobium sp. NBSH29]
MPSIRCSAPPSMAHPSLPVQAQRRSC